MVLFLRAKFQDMFDLLFAASRTERGDGPGSECGRVRHISSRPRAAELYMGPVLQGPEVVVQPIKPNVLPKLAASTIVVHDENIALPQKVLRSTRELVMWRCLFSDNPTSPTSDAVCHAGLRVRIKQLR